MAVSIRTKRRSFPTVYSVFATFVLLAAVQSGAQEVERPRDPALSGQETTDRPGTADPKTAAVYTDIGLVPWDIVSRGELSATVSYQKSFGNIGLRADGVLSLPAGETRGWYSLGVRAGPVLSYLPHTVAGPQFDTRAGLTYSFDVDPRSTDIGLGFTWAAELSYGFVLGAGEPVALIMRPYEGVLFQNDTWLILFGFNIGGAF